MQIEVLGDRYQLQDPIGRGGMATIYRGRDIRMDRVVAIKVLREVYSTDPKFVKRFQTEAKAASALQHPNIVQVYDYGQTDGNYYIVMELVEGTDLRRYLRSRGVLDVDRAVIIAHDVALGLGAAHRRSIVHRDVKPQNVLVGRGGLIKLTDFGIASVYKDINAERLTTTGMTLGTVQYYAPEQAQGEIVSPSADVYALGIVMYEMLTGRPPFDGDNAVAVAMQHIQDPPTPPSHLNPDIPPALEEIILRCLEKVPEMRFHDGSEMARALESLADSELGETVAGTLIPGHAPVPITYNNQIPSRPSASGRASARGSQQHNPASSPDTMLNGNGAASRNGAGGVQGTDDDRTVPLNQKRYDPPIYVPESGSPRPGQIGTVPRSGVVQQNQSSSRFATTITVLIFLATLILLGFSIYLAAELHFISIPFINGASTPTPSIVYTTVPELRDLSWPQAQASAKNAGFNLQSNNGTSGVVKFQSYNPGDKVPKGTIIYVTMGPITNKIPVIPSNATLAAYETLLQSLGFNKFNVKSDGTDQNLPPNTVSRVSPSAGSSVAVDTLITIYVKNLNATPAVTPSPLPTAKPSPLPTAKPSPSPTVKPSPTPSPSPSPIPDPTP
jgi:serine/threonine protein kinase